MKINLRRSFCCGVKLVGAALRAAVPCFDRGFDIAPDDSGSDIQSVSTELVMLSRAATADENDFSRTIFHARQMHQSIAEHRFPL